MRVDAEQAVAQALEAGVRLFQYRNKRGTRKNIYDTALRLAPLIREAGGTLIINDHADIACSVDADGVHLGQDDLPIEYARKLLGKDKLIGISTHSAEQANAAEAAGADYVGFGPIFFTSTKDAGTPQGLARIPVIRKAVAIPLLAIGGIHHSNAVEVIRAGADGVAVISAILGAADIKQAAKEMITLLRKTEYGRQITDKGKGTTS